MTSPYRLARGGPGPHARRDAWIKADEGRRAWTLHWGQRLTFAQIGAQLGTSTTTAWRRFWFWTDYVDHPERRNGRPLDHVPPQRGTRECPRGGPPVLVRDGGHRIRHPLPAIRCTARRTNGLPCLRWAIRGARVCPTHGGRAPQVRRAAAERVRQAEEMDRGLRVAFHDRTPPRRDYVRVRDLRAMVLAKHRDWHP